MKQTENTLVEDVFKPVGKEALKVGGILKTDAENVTDVANVGKGIGDAGKYLPYMAAGLAGLYIMNKN